MSTLWLFVCGSIIAAVSFAIGWKWRSVIADDTEKVKVMCALHFTKMLLESPAGTRILRRDDKDCLVREGLIVIDGQGRSVVSGEDTWLIRGEDGKISVPAIEDVIEALTGDNGRYHFTPPPSAHQ